MMQLDPLALRIIGALQVDGRASWRRIASVLGEPERTVARRGAELLADKAVVVGALAASGQPVLVRAKCMPGMVRVAASALARRDHCTFAYVVTGQNEFLSEVFVPAERLAAFVLEELAGIPGVTSIDSIPIIRYFRAVHEWRPGLLTAAEAGALEEYAPVTPSVTTLSLAQLRPDERAIAAVLAANGRMSFEELARTVRVSEPTARRRVDAMRRAGSLFVRASVDPVLLGLPVEALLWLRTRPHELDQVGAELIRSPYVRYAAATGGRQQLLAHVAVPDMRVLHEFITGSPWSPVARSVDSSLIIAAVKRTGVRADVT
jgi:DNA-binding Lrp family transcriptional regulator